MGPVAMRPSFSNHVKVPLHSEGVDHGQSDKRHSSASVPGAPVEAWMLREDVVREVLTRLARGEHVKAEAVPPVSGERRA